MHNPQPLHQRPKTRTSPQALVRRFVLVPSFVLLVAIMACLQHPPEKARINSLIVSQKAKGTLVPKGTSAPLWMSRLMHGTRRYEKGAGGVFQARWERGAARVVKMGIVDAVAYRSRARVTEALSCPNWSISPSSSGYNLKGINGWLFI
jgi:hypothetical protein